MIFPDRPNPLDPNLSATVPGWMINLIWDAIIANRLDFGPEFNVTRGAAGGMVNYDGQGGLAGTGLQQYRVIEEFGDYLACKPYITAYSEGELPTKFIAKPRENRSGSETWTNEPPYIAGSTIIVATPMTNTDAVDANDNPINLLDLNTAARRTDQCWARLDQAHSGTNNQWQYDWTEMRLITDDDGTETWEELAGGRSGSSSGPYGRAVNAIEANNDDSGLEGNSINVDNAIYTDNSLAIIAASGTPIVRLHFHDHGPTIGGGIAFQYVNAVDGSCAE